MTRTLKNYPHVTEPQLATIICKDLRDPVIDHYLDIESGKLQSPRAKEIHAKLALIPVEHREVFREALLQSIDVGLHDFLFKLQELNDDEGDVGWNEQGQNIAKESDGLHGELFGDSGWIARHSKHPNG